VTFAEIAATFGMMAVCPQHVFVICTKRPHRMAAFFEQVNMADCLVELVKLGGKLDLKDATTICGAINRANMRIELPDSLPLPNVILMTSVESHSEIGRVEHLLRCPAACHALSLEPLLEPVYLDSYMDRLGWVVVGTENARNARLIGNAPIEMVMDQCILNGVPLFVKRAQEGGKTVAHPMVRGEHWVAFPNMRGVEEMEVVR